MTLEKQQHSVSNQQRFKTNGFAEQTSFTTFDAIQNVQVREPSSHQSLDNLISSNRTSNNDVKKDHLYWERVSHFNIGETR